MKHSIKFMLFLAPLYVGLGSCEKEIEVDLNEAEPKLVIEGTLYAGTNLFTVNISQSTSYFNTEPAPAISNATVTLIDPSNISFNIPHIGNGIYQQSVTAIPNNTYTLEVIWDGNSYTASSYLPGAVSITGLRTEETTTAGGPGGGPGGGGTELQYQLYCIFDDPGGTANYYRIMYEVNGTPDDVTEFQLLNDKNSNGQHIDIPIQFGRKTFNPGDSVNVHLIGFDESTYGYILTLSSIVSSGGNPMGGSAAPGNPVNNWSGDILGYFFALNVDTMNIIIP